METRRTHVFYIISAAAAVLIQGAWKPAGHPFEVENTGLVAHVKPSGQFVVGGKQLLRCGLFEGAGSVWKLFH